MLLVVFWLNDPLRQYFSLYCLELCTLMDVKQNVKVDHSWHISLPFYIYSRDAQTLDTSNNVVHLVCRDQWRRGKRRFLIVLAKRMS